MTTLFEATHRLAGWLMPMWESDVTAQDDNSLTDSLAAFYDKYVGGTIFMLSGDLEGTSIIVTSKTSATILAFATQAANLDIGDHYALADADFNRGILRRAVNEALRELGRRKTEDTTLETVANQEEYTLPEGVSDVKEVWVATNTASPWDYRQLFHWDEIDGELRFPYGFTPYSDGCTMKVVYRGAHVDLDDDSDELPADLNHDLVHWQAAVWAVEHGMARFHDDPKRDLANKATKAEAELLRLKRSWHEWARSVRPGDW